MKIVNNKINTAPAYIFFFWCQEKISLMQTKITAVVKKTSAKLNTGKEKNAKKSLTPPKNILSNKFPSVPAKNKLNSRKVSQSLANKKKKSRLHTIAITQETKEGIGIHREIPVF